uniref:Uncharacterized protein n=1 Tax=Oryza meridionalis TaxID=40149 RepID=A0A0E0DS96_9ORYZ
MELLFLIKGRLGEQKISFAGKMTILACKGNKEMGIKRESWKGKVHIGCQEEKRFRRNVMLSDFALTS